jgi:hypothetical protein
VKLIDVFMAFLVVVGGLQFVYCVLVGNYVSAGVFKISREVGFADIQGSHSMPSYQASVQQ